MRRIQYGGALILEAKLWNTGSPAYAGEDDRGAFGVALRTITLPRHARAWPAHPSRAWARVQQHQL